MTASTTNASGTTVNRGSAFSEAGALAAYAALLFYAALAMPLRIPEILQLAARTGFESLTLEHWIALTPDSAPLNYYVQLPFVQVFGYTRFGARLDSILFAVAASYIFLRLARRIRIGKPLAGLAIFVLVPLNVQLIVEGRPFAQAMFLLLFATEWFLRLIERPRISTAAIYATALVLCIYTDRYAFLPAIGYLLFLLRFVNRAQERRAMWFALPSTVLPALLFLPFYLWASPQAHPYWPYPPRPGSEVKAFLDTVQASTGSAWIGFPLWSLVLIGVLAAGWATFRPGTLTIAKRLSLFCLFGGVLTTLLAVTITDRWLGGIFNVSQIFWALPPSILLAVSAVEWWAKRQKVQSAVVVTGVVLVLLSLAGDAVVLRTPSEDLQTEVTLLRPELTRDACIVFVTERFSKILFQLFAPHLKEVECVNFFHHRIVLASHAYVSPEQQEDAESFFRGLNFTIVKRIRSGGGQIVVLEQAR